MHKKSKSKKFWFSLTKKNFSTKKRNKIIKKTKVTRKNIPLSNSYKSIVSIRKKDMTDFDKGRQIARLGLSAYNSHTNNAPGYIGNTRIHHGEIGTVSVILGILYNNQLLTGIGTELMIDDIHDVNEWFSFKQIQTHGNSLNSSVVF